jgi:uncharacterized protein YceH (UPF0502 family)
MTTTPNEPVQGLKTSLQWEGGMGEPNRGHLAAGSGLGSRVVSVSELPVLDATDQRILGSLMEKQTTVPASYPLTANALRSACNQTSSREPVVDFDQQAVEQAARALKDRGLVRIVWADTGRRTLKYHQVLTERLELEPDEQALLTVLLLRGAQAPGELRTRTERLYGFADRLEVEACLLRMAERAQPLVRELERRPGQQDPRWIHLLGPDPDPGPVTGTLDSDADDRSTGHTAPARTLEEELLARAAQGWVPAADVMDLVRSSGLRDPDDLRDLALGLIARLMVAGLVAPGEVDGSTHHKWDCGRGDAITRIVEDWSARPDPFVTPGEIFWLDTTPAGQSLGEEVLRRSSD